MEPTGGLEGRQEGKDGPGTLTCIDPRLTCQAVSVSGELTYYRPLDLPKVPKFSGTSGTLVVLIVLDFSISSKLHLGCTHSSQCLVLMVGKLTSPSIS